MIRDEAGEHPRLPLQSHLHKRWPTEHPVGSSGKLKGYLTISSSQKGPTEHPVGSSGKLKGYLEGRGQRRFSFAALAIFIQEKIFTYLFIHSRNTYLFLLFFLGEIFIYLGNTCLFIYLLREYLFIYLFREYLFIYLFREYFCLFIYSGNTFVYLFIQGAHRCFGRQWFR